MEIEIIKQNIDHIENKLTEYSESVLTQKILVPLFTRMFKCKVEYVGGVNEKGRDIIIYERDIFGDINPIAVQVKKISPSSSSSSNRSFQALINQLSQASRELVIIAGDGTKVRCRSLFFVTPYILSQRAIDTHYEAYKENIINSNIKIIDCRKIVDAILEYHPTLLREIIDNNINLFSHINPKLQNQALMRALGVNSARDLYEIYCDVRFSIGGKHNEYYFYRKVIGRKVSNYSVPESNGKEFFSVVKYFEKELGKKIIDDDTYKNLSSGSYKLLLKDRAKNKVVDNEEKEDKENKEYNDVLVDVMEIGVDLKEVAASLEKMKKIAIELNQRISKGDYSCLREYLLVSEKISSVLARLKMFDDECISYIETEDNPNKNNTTLNIPIEKFFDTGMNITLLGEAGSGKTTALQVYTKRCLSSSNDRIVIFSSLRDIAKNTSKEKGIIEGVVSYLAEIDCPISRSTIIDAISRRKCVLVLDSIDECIVEHEWIIDALRDATSIYPECQIITSSRYSVPNVDNLPFSHISLLPFSEEQKTSFFSKWFSEDDSKPAMILEHLSNNPSLNRVVNNPLSATVLCFLMENDVPLPVTESALYRKRFDLMMGELDFHKETFRQKNRPELLRRLAKILAFEVHSNKKREFTKDFAIELLKGKLYDLSDKKKEEIFNELITPVEAIVTYRGNSLDFGHLRFQEYLCAEEMCERRFNIVSYLGSSWWKDSLLLYAQIARDIGWIIEELRIKKSASIHQGILEKMIDNRHPTEKESLLDSLNRAIAMETPLP